MSYLEKRSTNNMQFETIKRMQAYYRSALGQGAPASPEERQALRRAMIDYGALQPSPVQKPADSSKSVDTTVVASRISPTSSHHEVFLPLMSLSTLTNTIKHKPLTIPSHNNHNLTGPPITAPTQNDFQPTFAWTSPTIDVPPLEADETFSLNSFDLSNAELEEMMIHATQDFWASFPGEVGVGIGVGVM
jgi:hypothetical protein